jgi:antitoxin (DNA-binding transcriptional repressor) of toxin-antitoxin stability system
MIDTVCIATFYRKVNAFWPLRILGRASAHPARPVRLDGLTSTVYTKSRSYRVCVMPNHQSGASVPRRVGVRELRGNLTGFLQRASRGEAFLVTSHNQVIAAFGPPPNETRNRSLDAPRREGARAE